MSPRWGSITKVYEANKTSILKIQSYISVTNERNYDKKVNLTLQRAFKAPEGE